MVPDAKRIRLHHASDEDQQTNPRAGRPLNYNPDEHPSFSKSFKDEIDVDTLRWALQVKGVGVLVFRVCRTDHSVKMSILSKEDIGPCPDL